MLPLGCGVLGLLLSSSFRSLSGFSTFGFSCRHPLKKIADRAIVGHDESPAAVLTLVSVGHLVPGFVGFACRALWDAHLPIPIACNFDSVFDVVLRLRIMSRLFPDPQESATVRS